MTRYFGIKNAMSVGVLALLVTAVVSNGAFAESESLKEIFTDADFRGCVVDAFQSEVDALITEDSVLTEEQMIKLKNLSCNDKSLTATKLVGLEKLTGLTSLSLSTNQLASVDLASNVALTRLILANNVLTSLDLSTNVDLAYLDVRGNVGLDLDNLDISKTKLNTLTNEDGVWEYVEENTPEEEPENNENDTEVPACSSWEIDDETITIFKGMLAAYGYDTSRYDATAVRLAALQTNMCDGMDVNEARTLMNAMGVTDLSEAELSEIAATVTRAYNAITEGATLEELLAAMSEGTPLVPNTGVSTGEFNANVVMISLGAVMVAAGIFYTVRYGLKRREATVTFRRW